MYRRRILGWLFAATLTVSTAVLLGSPASAATRYTMRLGPTAGTIRAGEATTTTVSFRVSRRRYGVPVGLSVNDLPDGAVASFSPATPVLPGTSTLTLTTMRSSRVGTFTVTVVAITQSDPIGTSATFKLTIGPPCGSDVNTPG